MKYLGIIVVILWSATIGVALASPKRQSGPWLGIPTILCSLALGFWAVVQ